LPAWHLAEVMEVMGFSATGGAGAGVAAVEAAGKRDRADVAACPGEVDVGDVQGVEQVDEVRVVPLGRVQAELSVLLGLRRVACVGVRVRTCLVLHVSAVILLFRRLQLNTLPSSIRLRAVPTDDTDIPPRYLDPSQPLAEIIAQTTPILAHTPIPHPQYQARRTRQAPLDCPTSLATCARRCPAGAQGAIGKQA
jgi:hypothetical protein